jgi:hypothetical protein
MMDKDEQKFIEKIAGDDWMIWDEENGDGLDTDLIWEWFSTEMRKKWQDEAYIEGYNDAEKMRFRITSDMEPLINKMDKTKPIVDQIADVHGHTTKHYEYKGMFRDPIALGYWIERLLARARADIAQECYLQCLAVECGEGKCAKAVATKFPELVSRLKVKQDE